ncbi:MAG: hypothetical protein RLZZ383_1825 [Pseudomonadota bacterium]|jgi:hypothetical protein
MMVDLDDDEKAALEANLAWLASAGPDDWHRVVLDFHWDAPLYVLDWIVRQADCDIATALAVFWRGQPECWLVEDASSDEEPNGFAYLNRQICAYVANRVAEGGYARSEIAFVPDTPTRADYVSLVAAEQACEHPNFRAHPDLVRDRRGREVDLSDDFYRRYPEAFHHSAFSEAFADDIERGVYETPQSLALMARVNAVDRATLRRLPAWLKPALDLPKVQAETSSLVYGTVFVGIVVSALFTGSLSRFGPAFGASVGTCLLAYLCYGVIASVREVRRLLLSRGSELSTVWLVAALASGFGLGFGVAYPVLGHVGEWRAIYGATPVTVVGLIVVAPALALASRLLARLLVLSGPVRDDGV